MGPTSFGTEFTFYLLPMCFRTSPQKLLLFIFLMTLIIVLSYDLLLSQVSRLVSWYVVKEAPWSPLEERSRGPEHTRQRSSSFDYSLTDMRLDSGNCTSISFNFTTLYLTVTLWSIERDEVPCKVTDYGLDDCDLIAGEVKTSFFDTTSILAVEPTILLRNGYHTGASFLGEKRPEHVADQTPQSSTEV
jgi:hypothetical protein